MSDHWRPVGEQPPREADRGVRDRDHSRGGDAQYVAEYDPPQYRYDDSGYDALAPADADYADADYDESGYDDADYDESGFDEAGHVPRSFAFENDDTQEIPAIPAIPGIAAPATIAATRAQSRRKREAKGRRASRGKWFGVFAAATVLVVLAGLVFVGGKVFFGGTEVPADYAGPAGPPVVIEVRSGETADEIAATMADRDVVASASAFFNAAVQNEGMNAIQPGFYSVPTKAPAADAVLALVDPTSRVGQMVISEGRQLHSTSDVQTGSSKKGIYTLISEASCIGASAEKVCVSYDDLNAAGAGDLDRLGVPDWAKGAVANVPDRDRQLEGLIAAGSWNFDPTSSPTDILRKLVTESAANYERTGILTAGEKVGLTSYELLIAASLVEREAMPADFAKVARVIINRLAIDQALQFDSTVNYSLDTTELATTDADRARVTPWNTYASPGLPATPISSPSIGALEATESPDVGDWIYFVTVDAEGTTLFTKSYDQHLSNIELALGSGILDSGR